MPDAGDSTPRKTPVVFDRRTAARVLRATRSNELTPRGQPRRPARGGPWTYGVVRARVTTKITEGRFHAPGTGQARIYHEDADGVWRPSGDPVDVLNQLGGGDIDAPDAIFLSWIGGKWWVTAANCPDNLDDSEDPEEPGGGGPVEGPGDGTGLGD